MSTFFDTVEAYVHDKSGVPEDLSFEKIELESRAAFGASMVEFSSLVMQGEAVCVASREPKAEYGAACTMLGVICSTYAEMYKRYGPVARELLEVGAVLVQTADGEPDVELTIASIGTLVDRAFAS